MTRHTAANYRLRNHVGHVVRPDREASPSKQRAVEIDYDALRQHLAETPPQPLRLSTEGGIASGACHNCGRAVSGERIYCGPCLARRL